MARPNYQYGKRMRELAKKQKREAKMQRRLERKQAGNEPPSDEAAEGAETEENASPDDGDAEVEPTESMTETPPA